jgi:hypothetical protein
MQVLAGNRNNLYHDGYVYRTGKNVQHTRKALFS